MHHPKTSFPFAALFTGILFSVPWAASAQTPGRVFRSPIPSRSAPAQTQIVPTEDMTPREEPNERPQLAVPLRSSRVIPAAAAEPIPGDSEPLFPLRDENPRESTRTLPGIPEIARLPAQTTVKPARAGISASGSTPTTSRQPLKTKEPAAANSGEESEEGVTNLVKGEVEQFSQKVLYVWRFPFLKTKEFDLSLQVIIGGLFLLWLGQKLARRLSTWLGETALRRVGLPPATAAPLQKMSFYVLFGIFTVFSLQLVGVPMTVFTFFGGALAIGIGFGSQNVMNNFISGLILLIERPIRVGDMIQIDSHSGKVSEIGARSTRITTGSNLEVIVPNSTFLQGNVVNWTLSDDIISSKVTVGVAYGSPAREVARLLELAAEQHGLILKSPPPGVSFTEFSDHAMQFELSFWLKMSLADRGKVESDLRFKIDELFSDRGIVIAYPQRDVHLNLMRPVEVRLTESSSAARELRGAA
jgi:small-conductance mechanosensitive channel